MATRFGIKGRPIELYVRFVDANGTAINADDIPTVEIWDSAGVKRQTATRVGVGLAQDPGVYLFNYNIPLVAVDGYYTDSWAAKIGNDVVTSDFSFYVSSFGEVSEDVKPVYEPGDDIPWDFSAEETHGINILLKMLKPRLKNDGVRKVSDGLGGYREETCTVFTNAELITFLVNSLSSFNSVPHFSNFMFSSPQIYTVFADVMIQGAILLALAAQALIERGREFTMTDNGISFVPPAMSEILNTQYATQLADYTSKLKIIKCNLKPAAIGLGTFRVTSVSPAFLRLRHLRARQLI